MENYEKCEYVYSRNPRKGVVCNAIGFKECNGKIRCLKHREIKFKSTKLNRIIDVLLKKSGELKSFDSNIIKKKSMLLIVIQTILQVINS